MQYTEKTSKPPSSFGSIMKQSLDIPQDTQVSIAKPWYKKKLFTVCLSILVVEMCERLCFYSLSGTQKFLLETEFGYSNSASNALTNIFSMIVYGSCIIGGWIADSYLGRFKTIAFGGGIYAIGAYVGAFATLPNVESQALYFLGICFLAGMAAGAIKPNVSNLGADQYDTSIPEEARESDEFFSWFYLCINAGALIAYGVFSNWATAGVGAVPQSYGFFLVFMIGAVSMTIGMMIYLWNSHKYVKKLPEGNSLGALVHYMREARLKSNKKGWIMTLTWGILPIWFFLTIISGFVAQDILSYVSTALIALYSAGVIYLHRDNQWMEGFESYPGIITSDFRDAMDIVPTVAVVSTLFNICLNSMTTVWMSQTCQMNLMTSDNSQISAAVLNTADCIAIIMFTPIYTLVIQPLYRKRTGHELSKNIVFVAGLIIGISACVIAAIIESVRVQTPLVGGPYNNNTVAPFNASAFGLPAESNYRSLCAPVAYEENGVDYHLVMTDMTALWMAVPFLLIGIGEVLINAGMYAFTYSNTPTPMRSLMQAFTLLCQGTLSSGITASMSIIMTGWVPDDLNYGHASYVNYVYGFFALLGIPLYYFVNRTFVAKDYSDAKV